MSLYQLDLSYGHPKASTTAWDRALDLLMYACDSKTSIFTQVLVKVVTELLARWK